MRLLGQNFFAMSFSIQFPHTREGSCFLVLIRVVRKDSQFHRWRHKHNFNIFCVYYHLRADPALATGWKGNCTIPSKLKHKREASCLCSARCGVSP